MLGDKSKEMNIGRTVKVTQAVVDLKFEGEIPKIFNALKSKLKYKGKELVYQEMMNLLIQVHQYQFRLDVQL